MTESFTIHDASWRDLKGLRQLEHECFEQDSWPLVDLVAVLTLPGVVRLKADVGDVMAGFIAGDVRAGEKLGWVTTLCVSQTYRRLGIARALLQEAETRMGQPLVKLSVRRTNMGAIALYQRAGYQQAGVWPGYYTGGEDALVFEKRR